MVTILLVFVFIIVYILTHDSDEGLQLFAMILLCVSILMGVFSIDILINPLDYITRDTKLIHSTTNTTQDIILSLDDTELDYVRPILKNNGQPIFEFYERPELKNHTTFLVWPRYISADMDTIIKVKR